MLSKEENELTALKDEGFLKESGWIQSRLQKASMDANGEAIPWMTYSMIYLLMEKLEENMKIFEYGAGASSLFFAKRVKRLVSVEHDKEWVERLRPKLPSHAELVEIALEYGGEYCRYIHETKERFDLIVVDGRDRVNCCKQAVYALTESGVIILDNADRSRYAEGIDFLRTQGFRMIKFWGMAPMSPQLTCTALFYRKNNCFEI